jgi:hypothetical protein
MPFKATCFYLLLLLKPSRAYIQYLNPQKKTALAHNLFLTFKKVMSSKITKNKWINLFAVFAMMI